MNTTDVFPCHGRAKTMVENARKRNVRMSSIDRRNGNDAPEDCPLDMHLRTVLSALECGMNMREWEVVAEAAALLQDAELKARQDLASRN